MTYCTSHTCYLRSADPTARFPILLLSPCALQPPQVGFSLSENEPRNEGVLEEFFAPQPYSPSVQGQLKSNFIFVFVGGRRTSQRGRAQKSSRVEIALREPSQSPAEYITSCPTGIVVYEAISDVRGCSTYIPDPGK